jgi:hypothetical protein
MQPNATLVGKNFYLQKVGVTNLPLKRNLTLEIQRHLGTTLGNLLQVLLHAPM